MSDANENITNQPDDEMRRGEITNEPPRSADRNEPRQFALPPEGKTWRRRALLFGIPLLLILAFGLVVTAIVQALATAARLQSINNCKMMTLAVNSMADNTSTGDIPPAYGLYPVGSTTKQSFFVNLLPYIEYYNVYTNWTAYSDSPIKTYIAPADPYNPGTDSSISYGSNATVLTVGGHPTLPHSFNGRVAGVILVFERTARSGSTWSGSNHYLSHNYLIDKNGSSSPEFTNADSWSSYETRATALTSAGCVVGMADGNARVVTQNNANAGWSWAMDPSINSGQPAGW